MQEGGSNNSDILQNWFPLEIRSPLFNLYKFKIPEKSTLNHGEYIETHRTIKNLGP